MPPNRKMPEGPLRGGFSASAEFFSGVSGCLQGLMIFIHQNLRPAQAKTLNPKPHQSKQQADRLLHSATCRFRCTCRRPRTAGEESCRARTSEVSLNSKMRRSDCHTVRIVVCIHILIRVRKYSCFTCHRGLGRGCRRGLSRAPLYHALIMILLSTTCKLDVQPDSQEHVSCRTGSFYPWLG